MSLFEAEKSKLCSFFFGKKSCLLLPNVWLEFLIKFVLLFCCSECQRTVTSCTPCALSDCSLSVVQYLLRDPVHGDSFMIARTYRILGDSRQNRQVIYKIFLTASRISSKPHTALTSSTMPESNVECTCMLCQTSCSSTTSTSSPWMSTRTWVWQSLSTKWSTSSRPTCPGTRLSARLSSLTSWERPWGRSRVALER